MSLHFELQKVMGDEYDIKPHHVFKTIEGVHEHCKGCLCRCHYDCRISAWLHFVTRMVSVRWSTGRKLIRPARSSYMVASESVALDMVDYSLVRDIHAPAKP